MASLFLTGCGDSEEVRSKVTVTETGDGFFIFKGENEEEADEIEKLNKEIEDIKEKYNDSLFDDNESWIADCSVDHSTAVEQGTIFIKTDKTSLTGREEKETYLTSYAFNKLTGTAYTSKSALEMAGISGVELSMKIDKAFKVLEPDKIVHKTEMQGFLLDEETADLKFIYMKVISYDSSGEECEEFYLYDPAVDAMAKLEWPVHESDNE